MKNSKKQQAYLEILEEVVLLFRNAEGYREAGHDFPSCLLEADFAHNLPALVAEPSFAEEDLRWLNYDARAYVERGFGQDRPIYPTVCAKVAELMALVPAQMKPRLDWKYEGPT